VRRVPGYIGVLLAGTFVVAVLKLPVETIGSRFGGIPRGWPPMVIPKFHIGLIPTLASPALTIALLGALESLMSAVVADRMGGDRHNPNVELIAQGIANIASPLFGGLPATGAIARTATNIHSGAKTPFSAVIHALLILLYMLLLSPLLSTIPMAALAALLIAVAYHMSHWRQFIRTIHIAPKSDTIVLLTCFGFTVFIDMVAGVTAGVVLACFLLVRQLASLTQSHISHASTGHLLAHGLPADAMIYHINGPLFFGTVEKAFERTGFILDHITTLIIDMQQTPFIDMSGLVAMKAMILDMQAKNRTVILCGDKAVTDRILKKLPLDARQKINAISSMDEAAQWLAPGVP